MDEWSGVACTPITLNKYIYANSDAVNYTDPSGYFGMTDLMAAMNTRAILSTSGRTIGFNYTRMKGKKTITKAVTCEVGKAYIKKQYIGDGNQGHHPINKSFGAAHDQKLIFLPANTHRMFHLVLDVMLKNDPDLGGKGNWTKKSNWEEISRTRAGRKLLYKHIFTSAKLIDRFCGTKRRGLATFVRINRDRFVGE